MTTTAKQTAVTRHKRRGRPASFDRTAVIEQVMRLFWELGYAGLSFNEIAQQTGLTRASLYNAFNSKEALLMEALEHYFSSAPDALLHTLQEGDPIGPAFYAVFDKASDAYGGEDKKFGCFAVNCLNELMSENSKLGVTLSEMYETRRCLIIRLISQAIQQQELPKSTDPETTGNLLFTFIAGLSVFSKNGSSEATLRSMCHTFLRQIGFDKPS